MPPIRNSCLGAHGIDGIRWEVLRAETRPQQGYKRGSTAAAPRPPRAVGLRNVPRVGRQPPGRRLCAHRRVRERNGRCHKSRLAKAGKRCTVLASTASWNGCTSDPSTEVAPYTATRLREVTAAGFSPGPRLMAPLRVVKVEKAAKGGFDVTAVWKAAENRCGSGWRTTPLRKRLADNPEEDESYWSEYMEGTQLVEHTAQPPVLCTGFEGSVAAAARHLFNLADESDGAKGCLAGAPLLTSDDESAPMSATASFPSASSTSSASASPLSPTPSAAALAATREVR
eukprot:7304679-Prymnesium_polylepis.1